MEFLGIGPLELVTILLIIFLVMGPTDMVKTGAKLGRTLRQLRQSDIWRAMRDTTRELRNLPDTLARQADIDELKATGQELKKELDDTRREGEAINRQFTAWTRSPEPQSQKKTGNTAEKTEEAKDDQPKPPAGGDN